LKFLSFILIFGCFLYWMCPHQGKVFASEARPSLELGFQGAKNKNQFTRALSYVQPALKYSSELGPEEAPVIWETYLKNRLWYDPKNPSQSTDWSVRSLSTGLTHSHWKITLGFQEIPWGETFGPPILDIVNPRDFRDSLLLDPSWVRLPTASANAMYFFEKTTLQVVLTPKSRYPLLPTPGSSYDLSTDHAGVLLQDERSLTPVSWGQGTEFGGRISTLFDNGIDLGFLYYKHLSRNPTYRLLLPAQSGIGSNNAAQATALLIPEILPVQTIGNTLSYAFNDFVLRQDTALNLQQPLQNHVRSVEQVDKGTQLLSVIGLDWTSQRNLSLGAQIQIEYDDSELIHRFLDWASLRASYPLWENRLILNLFLYKGINNPDTWVQPEITLNITDAFSISLRADIVHGSEDPNQGYLWLVEDQSRIFTWMKAEF